VERKNSQKDKIIEVRDYVRQQRHSDRNNIKKLRQKGETKVYLDESFLHHYHGNQFSWFDEEIGDYLERPSGSVRRWCFVHAMLENGLVPNSCHIFEAKKSTGDYHDMFNALHFQEWWHEKLLPNLPPKCVIVMDRATYHLVPEEQIIPTTIRSHELQQWLTSKNISWETDWLKARLIQEVDSHIDKTPLVQKIAEGIGHKVSRMPVHHPELNPIETVWAIVKNHCGRLLRNGTTFKQVRQRLENAFNDITPDTCSGLFNQIKKKELEYWNTDLQIDNLDDNLND